MEGQTTPARTLANIIEENNSSTLKELLTSIVAFLFWIFVITKLFIFDVDTHIILSIFPDAGWAISFKLLIYLALIIVLWLLLGSESFLKWTAFVIFYPLILLFWQIPLKIWSLGDWNLAIAYLNALISFFRSIKFNVIFVSLFVITGWLILSNSLHPYAIIACCLIIFILLSIIFVNRFIIIFRPSIIFRLHSRIVSTILSYLQRTHVLDEDLRDLPITSMNTLQAKAWASNLQVMVLASKCCYFLSIRFQEYQKSRYNIIFTVVSLMLLFILTICCFGLLSFGLYQYDSSAYKLQTPANAFTFLFYSFNTIHYNVIDEVIASNNFSRGLAMIEQLFAFFLLAILFTLFLSIKNERESADISSTVQKIRAFGVELEANIVSEYKLSMEEALVELHRLQSSMIKLIYYISGQISSNK